jgi:hypothetical protein
MREAMARAELTRTREREGERERLEIKKKDLPERLEEMTQTNSCSV